MNDEQNNAAGSSGQSPQGGNGTSAETTPQRRSAAEIVRDLEQERDQKINKIRSDYAVKIAKAKRNAVPASERRKIALDMVDNVRDQYREAVGDLTLDDAVVDAKIFQFLSDAFLRELAIPLKSVQPSPAEPTAAGERGASSAPGADDATGAFGATLDPVKAAEQGENTGSGTAVQPTAENSSEASPPVFL